MTSQNPMPSNLRFAALATDIVCFRVVEGVLEILLGKVISEYNVFNGYWAHIGGLIDVHETADEAAERLMKNKAGLKGLYKEQLYTFSKVDRDPRGRVISVAYISFTNGTQSQSAETQTETLWKPVSDAKKLGYDHDEITQVAIDRLKSKIMYTDIARHLMPDEFTLSDLQKVYEAVLGEGMDKRNFRKRILSLDMLEDTKRTLKKGVMRPAALYTFKR